jgi:4-amino-4-deoxy-L-arabinose transferase-like glycosyltransferase
MVRPEANEKTRLPRMLALWLAMLLPGLYFVHAQQLTVRHWLYFTLAPLTLAAGIVVLVFFLANRLKKRILRMPEGL